MFRTQRAIAHLFAPLLTALTALMALMAAGCGADEPANAHPAATTTPAAVRAAAITWQPRACPEGLACGSYEVATVEVPVSYDQPDGPATTLAIARRRAADPATRIGTLVVSPDRPSQSASALVAAAPGRLPRELLDRFDLVAVDRRADGGTRDAARDLDRIRELLGEERISYLGYDDGTALGQAYASFFPDHVRAMVLDGVVDVGQSGPDLLTAQAMAGEEALGRFVDDCVDGAACPLGGKTEDAMALVDELVAEVEAAPVPARSTDRTLGPTELHDGLAHGLTDRARWPQLAVALIQAVNGDGSTLVAWADADAGVLCQDYSWPAAGQALADVAKDSPHFGPAARATAAGCAASPVPAQPLGHLDVGFEGPILVVGSTHDARTPYGAAEDLAEALPDGRLVTYDGDAHIIYASASQPNACVDDAVTRYLVDLQPPEDDVTCTPTTAGD